MKEKLEIYNLFDINETIANEIFENVTYPWEVLTKIEDFIIKLGNTLDEEKFYKKDNNIWIANTAKIAPTAYIEGPAIIDEKAEIRHCAFIRGRVIVGKNAVVGNSTEIKNAILFNKVEVPHFNYIGDSVLGYKAHMGAGSVTSNIKSDRKPVEIKLDDLKIETGMIKVGAFLGDKVEIGCGSVLNPGTIIGRNTRIYPLSSVRGYIGENLILKNKDKKIKKIKNYS